jgi:hypothetical protein
MDQRAFAFKKCNGSQARSTRWASDPRHAVNASFNDFELSVGKSIVRASIEKKRSWAGWALGITPRGAKAGEGGDNLKLKTKYLRSHSIAKVLRGPVRKDRVSGGEERRGAEV